jgi:hypothetical protein
MGQQSSASAFRLLGLDCLRSSPPVVWTASGGSPSRPRPPRSISEAEGRGPWPRDGSRGTWTRRASAWRLGRPQPSRPPPPRWPGPRRWRRSTRRRRGVSRPGRRPGGCWSRPRYWQPAASRLPTRPGSVPSSSRRSPRTSPTRVLALAHLPRSLAPASANPPIPVSPSIVVGPTRGRHQPRLPSRSRTPSLHAAG